MTLSKAVNTTCYCCPLAAALYPLPPTTYLPLSAQKRHSDSWQLPPAWARRGPTSFHDLLSAVSSHSLNDASVIPVLLKEKEEQLGIQLCLTTVGDRRQSEESSLFLLLLPLSSLYIQPPLWFSPPSPWYFMILTKRTSLNVYEISPWYNRTHFQ